VISFVAISVFCPKNLGQIVGQDTAHIRHGETPLPESPPYTKGQFTTALFALNLGVIFL
jgi:hypothetical protein